MMQLTMTGDCAVRAMIYLAREPRGTVVQTATIAEGGVIPEKLLRKILPLLKRAGLIRSFRGAGGGIILVNPPEKLTVLDVVQAVEGTMALNKCLYGPGSCSRMGTCNVHTVWCDVQEQVRKVLKSKSLAELASTVQKHPTEISPSDSTRP